MSSCITFHVICVKISINNSTILVFAETCCGRYNYYIPHENRYPKLHLLLRLTSYIYFNLGKIPKHTILEGSQRSFQLRECYESYVIYNFMMFLVTFMYEHYNVEQLLTYKPAQPQLFPFQKLPPWPKVRVLEPQFIKHGNLKKLFLKSCYN